MRSGEDAAKLMSILARHAKPRNAAQRRPTILDPSSKRALSAACTPTEEGAVAALCIDIPLLTSVKSGVELNRVLEFRSSDANDRARREYLGVVSAYVRNHKSLCTSEGQFVVRALEKMNEDMVGSAKALGKRAALAGLLGAAGIAVADILVPLTQSLDVATIATAAATAVGVGAGATVVRINKTEAEGYLGKMRTLMT
jgi:hypothetical protein